MNIDQMQEKLISVIPDHGEAYRVADRFRSAQTANTPICIEPVWTQIARDPAEFAWRFTLLEVTKPKQGGFTAFGRGWWSTTIDYVSLTPEEADAWIVRFLAVMDTCGVVFGGFLPASRGKHWAITHFERQMEMRAALDAKQGMPGMLGAGLAEQISKYDNWSAMPSAVQQQVIASWTVDNPIPIPTGIAFNAFQFVEQ